MNDRLTNGSYLIIIILIILTASQLSAQNSRICSQCKKIITDKYIIADGKAFHPDHFICAFCNKKIDGSYQLKDGKFYHPNCFLVKEGMICDYCQKILEDQYTVSGDNKYHKECYEEFILPKCSVCGLPLKDLFLVDNYGNKYHRSHEREMKQCEYCARLICQSLTGGGREYSDGRRICNLCYSSAVIDNIKFTGLLNGVMNKLKSFGLQFDKKAIRISGVDRFTLKSKSKNISDNTHGYCDSQTRTQSINDRVMKKITEHNIYILLGMPLLLTESTIAHELMHAWLNDNTKNNHSDRAREGSCNFISYIYLKSLNQQGTADFITMLEKNPDPIYGKGFLEIKSRYEGKSISEFLDYLQH